MGWPSAVGICQYLHQQLMVLAKPMGAELSEGSELRRDKPLPCALDRRVRWFFKSYIDKYDGGRIHDRAAPQEVHEAEAGRAAGWRADVRHALRAGALQAQRTSVYRMACAQRPSERTSTAWRVLSSLRPSGSRSCSHSLPGRSASQGGQGSCGVC